MSELNLKSDIFTFRIKYQKCLGGGGTHGTMEDLSNYWILLWSKEVNVDIQAILYWNIILYRKHND